MLQACIVGHVPPGSSERTHGSTYTENLSFTSRNNERYIELVVKYSHLIVGQFFGHLHTDTFRVIHDKNGK